MKKAAPLQIVIGALFTFDLIAYSGIVQMHASLGEALHELIHIAASTGFFAALGIAAVAAVHGLWSRLQRDEASAQAVEEREHEVRGYIRSVPAAGAASRCVSNSSCRSRNALRLASTSADSRRRSVAF